MKEQAYTEIIGSRKLIFSRLQRVIYHLGGLSIVRKLQWKYCHAYLWGHENFVIDKKNRVIGDQP